MSAAIPIECRVWERQLCELNAHCQPVAARTAGEVAWPAAVRNISRGGVALVLCRRFEPGTGLSIELPDAPTAPGAHLLARVVRVAPLPDGRWFLGCQFVPTLTAEHLQAVLRLTQSQPLSQGKREPPPLERLSGEVALSGGSRLPRGRLLTTVVVPNVVLRMAEAGGMCGEVPVRRFLVRGGWPIPADTILAVRFRTESAQPAEVTLKVLSCARVDGRWLVVYEFANEPAVEVVQAFGIGLVEE